MKVHRSVLIGFVFFTCSIAAAKSENAHTYSRAVQVACATDYRKHCAEYGLETEGLRVCMDKVAQRLSETCVNALVNAGEINKAEVERRVRADHSR